MRKLILLILFLGLCPTLKATHIVGGDFELKHINGDQYELTLNLYYDLINTGFDVETTEPLIIVHIFSKNTNILVESDVILDLAEQSDVEYTNPECESASIQTRLLKYRTSITLSPEKYNNLSGYYVIWERCCRNSIINNIQLPGDAGMTFYMEFPPVVKNSLPFINSSPVFNEVNNDFLCINQPFQVNTGAFDPDGDSLVYSFTSPIAGNSTPDLAGNVNPVTLLGGVPPQPAPYEPVSWIVVNGFSFSATQSIPYDLSRPEDALRLNAQTGVLSVTPNMTGLFVLSITCEEFRDGVKIGEVRREFQYLVLDCPVNRPPSQALQLNENSGNANLFYQEGQVLSINPKEDDLCFNLWVKDPDMNERLNITLLAQNFQPRTNIISQNQGIVNGPNDSLLVQICWPQCLFSPAPNEPFIFDIVVSDSGCPIPFADTLRIQLDNQEIINNAPLVSTDLVSVTEEDIDYRIEKFVFDSFEFEVFAQDLLDNDAIQLSIQGRNFNINDFGMEFQNVEGIGQVSSTFKWNTLCNQIEEEVNRFILDFITIDEGFCEPKADTTTVELIVNDFPFVIDETGFPNAFTPGDNNGKNDLFFLDLPEDNCLYQFQNIEIFNRWGNQVYFSEDRNFRWDGGDLPTGVYFYNLNYVNRVIKGSVSLLK